MVPLPATVALAVATALVGGLLTWTALWWDDRGDRLGVRLEAESGLSVAVTAPKPRTQVVSGTFVCLTGDARAKILAVKPLRSTPNVSIRSFALMAPGGGYGVNDDTDLQTFVDDHGNGRTAPLTRVLSQRCRSSDYSDRPLALELQVRGTARPAALVGLDITYRVNGRTKHVTSRNAVTFCSGRETSDDDELLRSELGLSETDIYSVCTDVS
ncbi:hypothetical protein ASD11_05825 [Aeromicrobium sp. Root495]|nr:hypothetical protein ASD11_05825 [Aeromicrobium sp. Root495]